MKKVLVLMCAAILLLAMVGCAQPVSGDVLMSDKARTMSPNVSAAQLTGVVKGNSAFALEAYQVLKKSGSNLFYSPYSLSIALAMTYAGARGETEKQMADAMNFTLPQSQLHPAFNQLSLALSSRGQGAKGKEGKAFRLNIVNAIWGQRDFKFLPAYLDTLAENYGAGLRILDFIKSPEDSRTTINKWVSGQTENRIPDLIPQGAIDTMTRLILTNAVYFDAAWQFPFAKESTRSGAFNLVNGTKVTAPLMTHTAGYGYAKEADYVAVELPYDGREISMVVIAPNTGQFEQFESSLDAAKLEKIIAGIKTRTIALTVPKFKFESMFSLKQTLISLGMTDAFTDGKADFSGMNGERNLLIKDVVHKSFVSVDEAGTEAAAASGVIVGTTSMPESVVIDRPFIFLIRDIQTGAVIFLGRVMNPGA